VLEQGAEKARGDPRAIRRVLNGAAGFGDTAVADAQARANRGGAPAGSGNGLLGSAEQMLETIQKHRAAGADTFHFAFPATSRNDDMRWVRRGGPAPGAQALSSKAGDRSPLIRRLAAHFHIWHTS
jgi:hypothetical protein